MSVFRSLREVALRSATLGSALGAKGGSKASWGAASAISRHPVFAGYHDDEEKQKQQSAAGSLLPLGDRPWESKGRLHSGGAGAPRGSLQGSRPSWQLLPVSGGSCFEQPVNLRGCRRCESLNLHASPCRHLHPGRRPWRRDPEACRAGFWVGRLCPPGRCARWARGHRSGGP